MANLNDLAAELFGTKRLESGVRTGGTNNLSSISSGSQTSNGGSSLSSTVGLATSDSQDGKVTVRISDYTTTSDIVFDDSVLGPEIEVGTTVDVKAGDYVHITLINHDTGSQPIVMGVIGGGDRMDEDVQRAKEKADEAEADAARAADAADEAASSASTAAAEASNAASSASTAATEASNAASSASNAATSASNAASSASNAASSASNAASSASNAASSASAAASSASEAAADASSAKKSAYNANEYASRALSGLSTVESVRETLTWITEHGTMTATSDTELDPTHVYYILDPSGNISVGGTNYSLVTQPNVADISSYYELSINASLQNYTLTHLALDGEGLWVLPDTNGCKLLMATGKGSTYTNAGTYIIDENGDILGAYTEAGVQIGSAGNSHIELDTSAFKMIDKDGIPYVILDDLRDESGIANISEVFVADGETSTFELSRAVFGVENVYVGVNGSLLSPSEYTAYEGSGTVELNTAPSNKATVDISYQTKDPVQQYTFGFRHNPAEIGPYSVAEGEDVSATGVDSHAEGYSSHANGLASHAEGGRTYSTGWYSHSEGYNSSAQGEASHAEGAGSTASGGDSHAEGAGSTASGDASHAEGTSTASGELAHSEGYSEAIGDRSHAEGGGDGDTIGGKTSAIGHGSHAEGLGNKSYGAYSHVQGKCSINDLNGRYAHIVGNGNPAPIGGYRSNAHTLDWDGNSWYQGDVLCGGTDGDSPDHSLSAKQDALTAGANVQIDQNNVISATDTTYTAGSGITISNDTISADLATIFDAIYPVGSVYMSTEKEANGNPKIASFIPNSQWERVTGRVLLGATDTGGTGGNSTASVRAGYTGGEATHKLTTAELASHTHGMQNHTHTTNIGSHTHEVQQSSNTNTNIFDTGFEASGYGLTQTAGFSGRVLIRVNNNTTHQWRFMSKSTNIGNKTSGGPSNNTTTSTGSDTAHNNMPPYLSVYIWKRTA